MGMTTAHSHLPVMRSPQHARSLRDVRERLSREDPDDVSRDVRAWLFYFGLFPLERPYRTVPGVPLATVAQRKLVEGLDEVNPPPSTKRMWSFVRGPVQIDLKVAKQQVEGPFRGRV